MEFCLPQTLIATEPNCVADKAAKLLRKEPMGVRTALKITTSVAFFLDDTEKFLLAKLVLVKLRWVQTRLILLMEVIFTYLDNFMFETDMDYGPFST